MLQRQHRVLAQHRLPRGDELFHPPNEPVQSIAQVGQERDHLGTLQIVLHQREAHQVLSELGPHRLRHHRLPEPLQEHRQPGLGQLVQAQRPAPAGHPLLGVQQAALLQPPQRRVKSTRAGLVHTRGREAEHLFQPVPGPRLVGDDAEQHMLEVGQRTPGHAGKCRAGRCHRSLPMSRFDL
jgi:hypothetical protein